MPPISLNLSMSVETAQDLLSYHLNEILSAVSGFSYKADPSLHLFAPVTGAQWDGGLMFVGRALYGWDTKEFFR